jgi:hypothetical protein
MWCWCMCVGGSLSFSIRSDRCSVANLCVNVNQTTRLTYVFPLIAIASPMNNTASIRQPGSPAAMDVDRAQVLEQYRAKLREHREVELR